MRLCSSQRLERFLLFILLFMCMLFDTPKFEGEIFIQEYIVY